MRRFRIPLFLAFAVWACASLFLTSCNGSDADRPVFRDSSDVGACRLPGSTVYDARTRVYTLTGAGSNMWNGQDAFHFAWTEVKGDFTLSAAVEFVGEGINPHRKMGLIVRQSLDPGSRYADAAVHGDGLTSLQYREVTDGPTAEAVSPKSSSNRLVLERQGDRILIRTSNYATPAGVDAEIRMPLPRRCYVGLFVCSHEDEALETALFSDVVLHVKK